MGFNSSCVVSMNYSRRWNQKRKLLVFLFFEYSNLKISSNYLVGSSAGSGFRTYQQGDQTSYWCNQCNYESSHRSNMNRHIRMVHGLVENWPCFLCPGKSFKNKQSLNAHKRSNHRNTPNWSEKRQIERTKVYQISKLMVFALNKKILNLAKLFHQSFNWSKLLELVKT